jgi:DNA-binding winged helix-turn-helix (wHTH) protein
MTLVLHFGRYRLDGGQRRLTRDGEQVHLTPKAFDLLCALAARAPRVLSKAELHQQLWPDSYVSEATLTGLVKEVRRAIDDPGGVSCIRTVHGVGYAFESAGRREQTDPVESRHRLVVAGHPVPLLAGENLIGRDPDAAVYLEDTSVSRRHAVVTVSGADATVTDLGSKNGTSVGDVAVTGMVRLTDGDTIRAGSVLLVYRLFGSGDSTVTHLE